MKLSGAEYVAMCRMRQVSERCSNDKAKKAAIKLELLAAIKADAISCGNCSIDEVVQHIFETVWRNKDFH